MRVLPCTPNDAGRATASILSGSSPSLLQRFQNIDDCHREDYSLIYSDTERGREVYGPGAPRLQASEMGFWKEARGTNYG